MNPSDRRDVRNLAQIASGSGSGRPPHSMRDMSGAQSQNRPGNWGDKYPGKSIQAPMNTRASTSASAYNPYNSISMNNTFGRKNGSSVSGNPTSAKTVLSAKRSREYAPERPSKRSRTHERSGKAITNTVSSISNFTSSRVEKEMVVPEYINVSDDEEDQGQIIPRPNAAESSSDPLSIRGSISKPLSDHAFDNDAISYPQPYVSQTSSVRALRKRQKAREHRSPEVISTSEIEDFTDDTNETNNRSDWTKRLPEPGHVKDKIKILESRAKERQSTPHIDLTKVQQKKPPLSKSMKPKSTATSRIGLTSNKTTLSQFGEDPISAPTLNPSKSSQKLSSAKDETTVDLPLEEWTCGLKVFSHADSPSPAYYFFSWNPTTDAVQIRRRQHSGPACIIEQISTHFIADMQASINSSDSLFLFHMKTRKYESKSKISSELYQPGAKSFQGKLTFKFDVKNTAWSQSKYQTILANLKDRIGNAGGHVTHIDVHASKALWDQARDAIDLKRRAQSREESREESTIIDQSTSAPLKPTPPPSTRVSQYRARAEPRKFEKGIDHGAGPARQSTRQLPRKSPLADPDELILVYPPTGTGSINITQGDLRRLDEGEYLNDTLIEFGLKIWLDRVRQADPELAESIHVFSSFFYKKLKSNVKDLEEGYQSVRKWTQKFDLFNKKFLIVPINEHLHWYLAVIYQPEHILLPSVPQIPVESVSTRAMKQRMDVEDPPTSPPPVPLPEVVSASASTSRSFTPEPNGVEELQFEVSCSISNERRSSPLSEMSSDKLTLQYPQDTDVAMDGHDDRMDILDTRADRLDTAHVAELDVAETGMDIDGAETTETIIEVKAEPPSKPHSSVSESVDGANKPRSSASSVPPVNFYGTASSRGKGKEMAASAYESVPIPVDVDIDISDDAEDQNEVDELLAESEVTPPATCIFMLDSLGSKHPQAIKILKAYLKFEARDKKGKKLEDYSEAAGYNAQVSLQPNFCDCGLYLLHLAKTFVKSPDHLSRVIRQSKGRKTAEQRKSDWDDEDVRGYREKLKTQVLEMSEEWKKQQAEKELQKKQSTDKHDSSDSDIDIVGEMVPAPKRPGRQAKATRVRG